MYADDIPSGGTIAILIVLITTILAPTWLSWWNGHVSKKELFSNGGKSFRDDFNKLVKTVDEHGKTLEKQNKQLSKLIKNQITIKSAVTEESIDAGTTTVE